VATLFFVRDCAEIAVPLGLMLLVGKYSWEKLKERKIEFNAHAAPERSNHFECTCLIILLMSRTQKWSKSLLWCATKNVTQRQFARCNTILSGGWRNLYWGEAKATHTAIIRTACGSLGRIYAQKYKPVSAHCSSLNKDEHYVIQGLPLFMEQGCTKSFLRPSEFNWRNFLFIHLCTLNFCKIWCI
jgi:hypothetical protein